MDEAIENMFDVLFLDPIRYSTSIGRIDIMLGTVYNQAIGMAEDLDNIEKQWAAVMNAWDQLKLGWAGATKDEVADFQAQINKVRDEIFGSGKPDPKHPGKQMLDKPGLYQQVRGLALHAVATYDNTDQGIDKMFRQMVDGDPVDIFAASLLSGGDPELAKQLLNAMHGPVKDHTSPPITETF